VQFALSIANLQDFTAAEEGGIEATLLVPRPPRDEAEKAALRAKVMSRDMVVGNLISADAGAVVIYCFAEFGTDPKEFSQKVEEIVRGGFGEREIYWGGAPFISTYIYGATQDDLRVLTPWAVLIVIIMVILSFRDAVGALLSLLSTGMGIATAIGLMGMLGIDYNLVLSSMPVILFSVGSAYAIHVIARYYQVADRPNALEETLASVGPTVLAAGLTTVAGMLSYVAMDIAPMRTFGIFSALGVLWTLVLSLTFVPAIIVLLKPKRKSFGRSSITAAIAPVVELAHRRPRLTAVALLVISMVGLRYALTVDSRMDQTAFFSEGSPPDRADRFLLRHFGGATFIQVAVTSDFTRPEVLRELERVADRIQQLPAVSYVQHAGQVVAQVNMAMEGERRIPDDAEKVKALYRFLTGNPAVAQLVTSDHDRALMVIKVRSTDISEIEETLAEVERIAAEELPGRHRVVSGTQAAALSHAYLAGRIRVLLQEAGIELPRAREETLLAALKQAGGTVPPARVEEELIAFLASDECLIDLATDERRAELARALVAVGPHAGEAELSQAIGGAIEGDTIEGEVAGEQLVADLLGSVRTPLAEIWRRERAKSFAGELLAGIAVPPSVVERVAHVLPALESAHALVPDAGGDVEMRAMVSGLPVLHRGMSESSTHNQIFSMTLSLSLVFVILMVAFRSLLYSLIATSPMVITLIVIYGGMGWLGVHLDIGTSMLASIVIGAGVDYAVHLLVAWKRSRSLLIATEHSGPAIWTNALMVAAGFFVLTLGEARPLQNVGGLTAAAMLVAALSTFLSIPMLGGWMGGRELQAAPESVTVPEDSPKGATS
jgi:predicted RND superfamily exporter protein